MIRTEYYRILDHALSTAKRYDFTPNEFYYMLDGIILCAQYDYDIMPEEYIEIVAYKEDIDKITEEIGK